jgi:hypothetical protein
MLGRAFLNNAGALIWPGDWHAKDLAELDKDPDKIPGFDDFRTPLARVLFVREQVLDALVAGTAIAEMVFDAEASLRVGPRMSFHEAVMEAGLDRRSEPFYAPEPEEDSSDEDLDDDGGDDADKTPARRANTGSTIDPVQQETKAREEIRRFAELTTTIDPTFWEDPEINDRVDWVKSQVEIQPRFLLCMFHGKEYALSINALRYTQPSVRGALFVRDPLSALAGLFDLPPVPNEQSLQAYAGFRAKFLWPELTAVGWRYIALERPTFDSHLIANIVSRMQKYLELRGYVYRKDKSTDGNQGNSKENVNLADDDNLIIPGDSTLRIVAGRIVSQARRGVPALSESVLIHSGRLS